MAIIKIKKAPAKDLVLEAVVKEMIFVKKMSLGALGIYMQMIKVPEYDYLTFNQICGFNEVDPPTEIRKILDELLEHGFIIHPDKSNKIYAVNKPVLINCLTK
ncbi:MAG: hypothetical protein IJA12_06575 [Oscillospiraceae bacterium]|nr:hypothetical protein [Oscillospiraceae bacterium]